MMLEPPLGTSPLIGSAEQVLEFTSRAQDHSAAVVPSLISVLIPCCGQLEYTRLCVPRLLKHSRPPCELLFLDIGSLDGTAEYLAGVAAAASMRVEVVRAVTDIDLPSAVQTLLAQVRGEFLVLLNNDTVVVEDWLDQLTALARMSPRIGLVGPMSNYAAPPQFVETVPYTLTSRRYAADTTSAMSKDGLLDVTPVQEFARSWREQHRGKWMTTEHLGGFCLLLKREVLTRLGPLGSHAGLEVFDTDALCHKARQAGYELAVCRDLFIHHFGSRTFAHGGPTSPQAV